MEAREEGEEQVSPPQGSDQESRACKNGNPAAVAPQFWALTLEVELQNGAAVLLDVPCEASTTAVLQDLVVAALGLPPGTQGSFVQFDEAWQREVVQPLWLPVPLWNEEGIPRFPTGGRYQFRVRPMHAPELPARGNDLEGGTGPAQQEASARGGWEDSEYFNEYGETVIHLQMLADGRRNDTYAAALAGRFEGKTVVDVGAGTGFLSVLAARAGAKRVHAIEASDMASKTELVCVQNDVDDTVQVHHSMVENVQLEEKVDAIVSEWMGCFLLYEGMLGSVLFARDRWLKEGGLLFPCQAKMFLAPISWPFPRIDNLRNVCGVKLGSLIPWALEEQTLKVQKVRFSVTILLKGLKQSDWLTLKQAVRVTPEQLLATEVCFWEMDLYKLTTEELEEKRFKASFEVNVDAGAFMGFVIWFEVSFPPNPNGAAPLVLSTSPRLPPTHWEQDAFLFEHKADLRRGDTIEVCGRLKQHLQWRRHYELEFSADVGGKHLYKHFLS